MAAPAHALSCLPHDVAQVYRQAAAAEETYLIVHGRLDLDAARLPRTDWQDQAATPPVTLIPARLAGHALGPGGEGARFDAEITLEALCFGPWCAGARAGTDYLAFLERREEGYVLVLDPCGGMGFAEPGLGTLDRLRACLAGESCAPRQD